MATIKKRGKHIKQKKLNIIDSIVILIAFLFISLMLYVTKDAYIYIKTGNTIIIR